MTTVNDLIDFIIKMYSKFDPDLKVFVYTPYGQIQPELVIMLSNGRRMILRQSGAFHQWDMQYVRKFFRITRKLLHRQLLNRIGLKIEDIWAY